MGLTKNGYRQYREAYKDDGIEILEIMGAEYTPDFYNRNTIQIWDASNYTEIKVNKWKGATLTDRTIHEITIVNNSNTEVEIDFNGIYILSDEETIGAGGLPVVVIGANETAYFYATALIHEGNLEMNFRTGSQDTRK